MYRKKSVRSSGGMCCPSTSASAIVMILWYPTFAARNSSPTPAPMAVMRLRISSLPSIWSSRAFSTFRIFPRNGRIAWNSRWRPCFADPRARPRLPPRLSCLRCQGPLLPRRLGDLRVLEQKLPELLVHRRVHDALDLGVPELHLRLALKLRLREAHGENRREPLAHVLALQPLPVLQPLVLLRVRVHRAGERGLEPDQVGAALHGVNVVHEREHGLRVPIVPLQRGFDERPVALLGQVDWRFVQRRLRAVNPLDAFDDPPLPPGRMRASSHSLSAFTTLRPTPWSPPETR